MSNRSAKFVATIFASILAGTSFAAMAQDAAKGTAAKTADTCLPGPKGPAPAGAHWYYRSDRVNKRSCWYLGEEKNKSARAAPKDSTAAAAPAPDAPPPASPVATDGLSPQPSVNANKSFSDARAEFTAPQARLGDLSEPQSAGAAPVGGIGSVQRATTFDTSAPASNVASRWPESSGVSPSGINPSGSTSVAAAEPQQAAPTESPQAQSLPTRGQQAQIQPTNAAPAPKPSVTPVALAAADSSQRSASTQLLLMTMAGALALAGITASLIFRFGRPRPAPEMHGDRRAIWDSVPAELRAPSMYPAEDIPIWRRDPPHAVRRDLPRDPRAPDDPERRVTEMLARLARSAQT